MSDNRLQEIMTRAVVGRAERTLTWCHQLPSSQMKQVLGVRVGKTDVSVDGEGGKPLAELMIDCDLWCSSGEQTKVLRTRCHLEREIALRLKGDVLGEERYRIELISPPRSTGVRIDGDSIYVDFEATVQVEVIALTRLFVKVYEMDWSGSSTGDQDLSYGSSASPYGSH